MEGRVGIKLNDRMSQIVSSVLSSHTTTNTTSLTEEDINILRADRDRGVLSPRSFKLISHWNQQHQGPPLFSAIKEVKAELPKLKRDPIEVVISSPEVCGAVLMNNFGFLFWV